MAITSRGARRRMRLAGLTTLLRSVVAVLVDFVA